MRRRLTRAQAGLAPAGLAALGLLLAAAPAHASAATANPRTDFTAYTRPGGRVAVGPLKLELGVFDEVLIGTYVPPWFAFPALGVPLPNVYVKARSWWEGPLTLAVRGSTMYVAGEAVEQLASGDASGSMTTLSAEADLSLLVHRALTVSFGAEYTHVRGNGNETANDATSIEGAAAADNLMGRLFAEWRLSRVFSLTLLARALILQTPVTADTSYASADVSVDAELTADTEESLRGFSIVPGVAFEWENWDLSLGVGYGALPLPIIGATTARALPVVDFALAYRFDLYN